MNRVLDRNIPSVLEVASSAQQRQHFKHELRQKIQTALQSAKELAPDACLNEIKNRLLAIQMDCGAIGKPFIVVEEMITCDQYELGGRTQDTATLFRGPHESASVAICVTLKGSLLHRNSNPWQVYRNAGDVNPR